MQAQDLLLTFMAVAVTFSGFTGVVALIDRRAAHVSQAVIAWRVRNLNIAVLLVMALSTAPYVLSGFGVDDTDLWRLACALAFGVGALYIGYLWWARRRLLYRPVEGFSIAQFNILMTIGVFVVAALLLASLNVIAAVGTYLIGVFGFVCAAASFFMRLVLMVDASIQNTK